jgi:predicted 2-oxoglutarate/Fe(II)-dependent dioxygenase YbiX
MEVNVNKLEMDRLNTYIRIYDNVLLEKNFEIFTKICEEHVEYEDAKVINHKGDLKVDTEVRNVQMKILSNIKDKSFTTVHWTSLLLYKFTEHIDKYVNDFNMHNFQCAINDIQILKYTKGGHYKLHCDHGPAVPRTLSLIYFVNDDYQGGDLIFKLINTNDEIKIQNKKNRLIIWPSNFMYPHCVTPVTNGVRYSVVAWAL